MKTPVKTMKELYGLLNGYIQSLDVNDIPDNRKPVLQQLIDYINQKIAADEDINLIFICTHNSRRSQFSQIWAQIAAFYYGVPKVKCYSGGVEVTAFNERAVKAIEKTGVKIAKKEKEGENPVYFLTYSGDGDPITAYSKLYDDALNAQNGFAAIMTCSDADDNCPFIPGTQARIPLNYEDPKNFDGTPQEEQMYDERCRQVATEMFYVFSKLNA